MSMDTRGVKRGELRVTLREDQPAGVHYDGRDIMPGETATLPHAIAAALLNTGRARIASEELPGEPIEPPEEPVIETPEEPVVETRDPSPESRDPQPKRSR